MFFCAIKNLFPVPRTTFSFFMTSSISSSISSNNNGDSNNIISSNGSCSWPKSPLDRLYHDTEWGVPVHSDSQLFEALVLDGAQAGLSWSTVLAKRENYRKVYRNFDIQYVASLKENDLQSMLENPGIIRNRLKLASSVQNAKVALEIQKEFGSLSSYFWKFVDGKPQVRSVTRMEDIPTSTPLSDEISKDLKKRGMSFVGTTIIYAFLQAVGLVDDHFNSCPQKSTNRKESCQSQSNQPVPVPDEENSAPKTKKTRKDE